MNKKGAGASGSGPSRLRSQEERGEAGPRGGEEPQPRQAGRSVVVSALAVLSDVEAFGLDRSFEITDLWETGIVAETDLSLPPPLPGMVWVDDEARESTYAVTWYGGRGTAGFASLAGVLQLGGAAHLRLGRAS